MYDIDEFINGVLEKDATLEEDRKALLGILGSAGKSIVKGVDFGELSKDIEDSVWELFQNETPPNGTKIIHFGLRETADGCSMYVVGSMKKEPPEFRDSEDWDWTGPKGGHLYLPKLNVLWNALSVTSEEEWEVVLAVVIICIKSYLRADANGFLDTAELSNVKVTVGFDDGDLYEIPFLEE